MYSTTAPEHVSTRWAVCLALFGLVVASLSPGCAAPWEQSQPLARTIYAGTLAGLREACDSELFPADDTRWQRACSFVRGLPDRVGAVAEDDGRRVRVMQSGRVELP